MDAFWTQDKLFLMIALFQFGLILVIFTIINIGLHLGKPNMSNDSNPNALPSAAIAASRLNDLLNHQESGLDSLNLDDLQDNLQETDANPQMEVIDIPVSSFELDLYKIAISPDLFTELLEISNNPAESVDEAIRWWLRRRTLYASELSIDRGDRLSTRSYSSKKSQQELWND